METSKYNQAHQMLMRLNKKYFVMMSHRMERLNAHTDLPPVLFIINDKPGIPQNKLAAKLHIQPGTMTVRLKRMEKAGLIERKADDTDARITRVYLTEKGDEARKSCAVAWNMTTADVYSCLDEQELLKLEMIVEKLLERIEELD